MSVITSVQSLDNRILLWSLKLRDKLPVMRIVRLVSSSGDGYAQVLAILLLALLNQQNIVYSLIVLFAIERAIYWFLKNTLSVENVTAFIEQTKPVIRQDYPDVASAVVNHILSDNWQHTAALVEQTWAQVKNHPTLPGIAIASCA